MSNKRKNPVDRKSRTRGQVVSFIVHLILLLFAFLPFLAFQAPEEPTKESLVIQFDYPYNQYVAPEKFVEEVKQDIAENMDEGSKMSGSDEGGNESKAESAQSRPQQSAPAQLSSPTPAMTKPAVSSALRSNVGEIPLPTPKIVKKQAWASVNDFGSFESDGVEEMQMIDWSEGSFGEIPGSGPGGDGDDDSSVWNDGFGNGPGGGNGGTGNGTGSTAGNGGPGGGTGTGSAGNKTGVGQNGNGLQWGVGLDGAFNRKMLRRANVASLAVKEGRIAIIICLNREGIVTSTKYDIANSTLKDPAFIAKAEAIAKDYIFERDPTAPERHCGKLTFIFKIK